jgi:hypothetical protein
VQKKAALFPIPGAQRSRRATALQALFEDEDLVTGDDEEAEETYDETFWNIIDTLGEGCVPKVIRGISLDLPLSPKQPQGLSYVTAKIQWEVVPPSFRVEKASSLIKEGRWIYWLPWEPGRCTSARREDYESSCSYFFTAELDGCTFVITDEEVMHVAHDYNGKKGKVGEVEGEIFRLTPADYQGGDTKRRGFVFGVRRGKNWIYYLCKGPALRNCESVIEIEPQQSYPYGSPEHFSLM